MRAYVRACVPSTCGFACQALTKRGRYSLVHCRPCFCCRLLLQSEQVAQLEKDPGTSRWLFPPPPPPPPPPPASLPLCRPFSRLLPCGRDRDSGGGVEEPWVGGWGWGWGSVAGAPHLVFVEGAGHPVPQRAQGPPHLGALLHLLCAVRLVLVPAHVCCSVYVDPRLFVTPGGGGGGGQRATYSLDRNSYQVTFPESLALARLLPCLALTGTTRGKKHVWSRHLLLCLHSRAAP